MGKTKLELEKEQKRSLAEANEVIEQTGQENEAAGAKVVTQILKEKEEKQTEKRHWVIDRLDSYSRQPSQYREYIEGISLANLRGVEWGPFYRYSVHSNKQGLLFEFFDTRGHRYAKGIALSFNAEIDLAAVDMVITQIENTVDKIEGRSAYGRETSLGGANIVLPAGSYR